MTWVKPPDAGGCHGDGLIERLGEISGSCGTASGDHAPAPFIWAACSGSGESVFDALVVGVVAAVDAVGVYA
jgi:hypothetical protein